MKTIFFDTNSYSSYSKGDIRLKKAVDVSSAVFISIITVGELYAGFINGIPIVFEFAIFLAKKYCSNKTIEYIPTISWMHDYEIYRHTRCIFKCNRYTRYQENVKKLHAFLEDKRVRLIELNHSTALLYGKLMSQLYKKGTPIPTNDVWIAASVIETKSTLVTYDTHFLKIPGLSLWKEIQKKQ